MLSFLGFVPYFCAMIRVIILGAGNVASHLYRILHQQTNVEIVQCYNRRNVLLDPMQSKATITNTYKQIKEADVYILAVSDDAISEVSGLLPFTDKLVVHTSGSAPITSISEQQRRGVFYPLQTFSKEKAVNFKKVPFCIEAEQESDFKLLWNMAASVSEKVYKISSLQRSILHVSAVFVNNFTNHLFTIGKDICDTHEVPFEILHPLIQETARKITEINPDQAQTGPAMRNDIQTISRHMDTLEDPTYRSIYQLLTQAIQIQHGKKL